jgi:hypothetical protein
MGKEWNILWYLMVFAGACIAIGFMAGCSPVKAVHTQDIQEQHLNKFDLEERLQDMPKEKY